MFKRSALTGFVAVALLATACNTDPSKDKSKAQVSEPAAQPAAAATHKDAVRYTFSDADSKVSWVAAKVTRKHDGGFGEFTGKIDLVDNDPTRSQVTIDIATSSLHSNEPKLTEHLKSPDFFDVAKFPKATFTSTSIKAGGADGATHTVTGNLEMHGVTKAVTFPATIKVAGDSIAADAEFAINRKDWGLVYPGMPDDLIKDQILLKLTIRAKNTAA